jgi:tRNA 2-thiocytidine biosynthesis protein TtcA
MPPKLLSDDKRNILIRPLAYCNENDIAEFAEQKGFPIIPCNLCGSQENLQRQVIKDMLQGWEKKYPGRTETIFSAIKNVTPSQLADMTLFDFVGLKVDPTARVEPESDSCATFEPTAIVEAGAVQYLEASDILTQ